MTDEERRTTERRELERALAEERALTEARVAALRSSLEDLIASSEGSPPDDEHDPDGATSGFERAQISALLEKSQHDLTQLDRALERLSTETYGICARCGGRIAFDRLLARPSTTACIACAAG